MKVKICGFTRAEDALYAQKMGAWALGFIFYPASKRYISIENAGAVMAQLPAAAQPVGVFVNQMQDVARAITTLPLKGIQLHGDESPADCQMLRDLFGGFIIKAFRVKRDDDLAALQDYEDAVDYFLIDAAVEGAYGGTGQLANWDLAKRANSFSKPLILSGGLNPENIAEAATVVAPHVLDLAGGVESSPGIKDAKKIEQLFNALKDTEDAA